MRCLTRILVASIVWSALPVFVVAEDPQLAVERIQRAIVGDWTIASIEHSNLSKGALDCEWFDGIRWAINSDQLVSRPGGNERPSIVGGTKIIFDLAFSSRTKKQTFILSGVDMSKKWIDDDPYAITLSYESKGETVKLFGLLQLQDQDRLIVSFGSSKRRPQSLASGDTLLGVYTLERVSGLTTGTR